MTRLVLRRNPDETWRDVVARLASAQGLATECLERYDAEMKNGDYPSNAAWTALYEWDCIPCVEEDDDLPRKLDDG